MKRREFFAAPALAALLPRSFGHLAMDGDTTAPSQANWQQHRQRLHQDFETYAPGIEYFMLGNGEIQVVLQYMPDRSGERPMTFLGLTIMDAERFARKWSTFLFHPERGLDRSMASVWIEGKGHAPSPETVESVGWSYPGDIPTVIVAWKAGACAVREYLWVPSEGRFLFRALALSNTSDLPVEPTIGVALVPSFALFDDIGVNSQDQSVEARGFASMKLYALEENVKTSGRYDLTITPGPVHPGAMRNVILVYQLDAGKRAITKKKHDSLSATTSAYWASRNTFVSGDQVLDHQFAASRTCLKGMISRTGKRDSGIWMYNMEWVRDDMMVMLGLLHAGFPDEARTMLVKTLERSVAPDGCMVESSRWSGYDLTELDQNGALLYGAWSYFCWTGNEALIRKHWKTLVRAGDYPLLPVFWDPESGLMRNKREFWERGGEMFGIEDGFELSYQFWVAIGLEKGAALASVLGDRAVARRWTAAAAKIRYGMLEHPKFRMIENGALIKRRTRDSRWQRHTIPANRSAMPPGSPLATIEKPECDPDTSCVLPVVFGMVDPKSPLAAATLESMESLWNQSWTHGGYSRYNTTSEPDPPAPWPFATLFVARAYAETGNDEKVWRALHWLNDMHGGKAGAWFERYGPSITPPAPPVCVVGWTWAEFVLLFVSHFAGIRPEIDRLVIRPKPLKAIAALHTTQNVRGATIELEVRRNGGPPGATVDGRPVAMKDGRIEMAYPGKGRRVRVVANL
ncbi:MAG: hypothetical protein AB1428_08380 [Bacteroidota bacterium]